MSQQFPGPATDSANRIRILKTWVHVTTRVNAVQQIVSWAEEHLSADVYLCNVHVCMEAYDDETLERALGDGSLVLADGRPIYWLQRLHGASSAAPITGRELVVDVCAAAAASGLPVGFLGSTPATINGLVAALRRRFPKLEVSFVDPSMFRPLTPDEDRALAAAINASGTRILFVGLGCPKQERFLARHRGSIGCVMLGVGAAFDFLAGTKPVAPAWVTDLGFEWLFRLLCEPRRLWRRYLVQNTRFLWHLLTQN